MSGFNLSADIEYHSDTNMFGSGYGRVDMHLILDEESRRAFYEWMADGCKGSLLVSKDGLEYPKMVNPVDIMPGGTVPFAKELSDEGTRVKK